MEAWKYNQSKTLTPLVGYPAGLLLTARNTAHGLTVLKRERTAVDMWQRAV